MAACISLSAYNGIGTVHSANIVYLNRWRPFIIDMLLAAYSLFSVSFQACHGNAIEVANKERKLAIYRTWVGISNADAIGIVWKDRTSKNSKQKSRNTTIVAVCAARYIAIVLLRHFACLVID